MLVLLVFAGLIGAVIAYVMGQSAALGFLVGTGGLLALRAIMRLSSRSYRAGLSSSLGPADVQLDRIDQHVVHDAVYLPHLAEQDQIRRAPRQAQDTLLYGLEDQNGSLKPYNGQRPVPVVVRTDACPLVGSEKGLVRPVDTETPEEHRARAAWVLTENGIVDKLPGQDTTSEFYRRDWDVKRRQFAFTKLYAFDRNGTGAKTGYGQETQKRIAKMTQQMRRDPYYREAPRTHPPPAFGNLAQQA